jgi:phospholipid-translocating ATPase
MFSKFTNRFRSKQDTSPQLKNKSAFPVATTEGRTIYVNMQIPPDDLDDYNQPLTKFISNKINTAKYTWYSFIPKNLFEQFRGIANLYFLFLVILQMFPLFSAASSPVLVVLPLAAILVLTGAKDAFEDNKRQQTDKSVNHATTFTLHNHWKNVNIPVYKVARWKRGFHYLKGLFKRRKDADMELMPPSSYNKDTVKSSLKTTLKSTASFSKILLTQNKRQSRGMPYRPGQVPHSVLRTSVTPQHLIAFNNEDKSNASNTLPGRQSTSARQPLDYRWRRTMWKDIKVGDFVVLRNDDAVPADLVVLSSSEPEGLCYVETQNLDGETNLKIKRSLQATNEIKTPEDCERAKFYIESEPPHPNLYSYNGVLKWKVENNDLIRTETTRRRQDSSIQVDNLDTIEESTYNDDDSSVMSDGTMEDIDVVSHEKTEAITGSSVLLRGCVLRNTGWVIGLVLFTGNETKIMLNSGKTPSKRSKMEKATNPYVSL